MMILKDKNFFEWEKELNTLLEAEGLNLIFEKEYVNDEVPEEDKVSQARALLCIYHLIDDKDLEMLLNVNYSKKAFEILRESKLKKENFTDLICEVVNLKWVNTQDFLNKMCDLKLVIQSFFKDAKIPDEFFTSMIIKKVPKEFTVYLLDEIFSYYTKKPIDFKELSRKILHKQWDLEDEKKNNKMSKQEE